MTAPLLAHATDYGRMYARSTTEQFSVPSITTVIGQQAHSLDGWFSYMGASSLAADPELPALLGSPARIRQAVNKASKAAEAYRDQAAARGDRVHNYCEQVALRALGRPHRMQECRDELASHGEQAFAARFDEWWELYRVEPLAPEITVWNKTVGYAGTLDLVARINGRICLIDYKTKGTSRDGTVKALDDKVVMQLVAGMKAEESLVDPVAGEWEPWKFGVNPMLLAVAIGETEVRPQRANPDVLKHHWWKFCALRRVWEMSADVTAAGQALMPVPPPSFVSPSLEPAPPSLESASLVPAGAGTGDSGSSLHSTKLA